MFKNLQTQVFQLPLQKSKLKVLDKIYYLFNAQELIHYRFGFKCDTNRIRQYFLSELRFEPGSLG
jgi:hypothetical protein